MTLSDLFWEHTPLLYPAPTHTPSLRLLTVCSVASHYNEKTPQPRQRHYPVTKNYIPRYLFYMCAVDSCQIFYVRLVQVPRVNFTPSPNPSTYLYLGKAIVSGPPSHIEVGNPVWMIRWTLWGVNNPWLVWTVILNGLGNVENKGNGQSGWILIPEDEQAIQVW